MSVSHPVRLMSVFLKENTFKTVWHTKFTFSAPLKSM